MSDMGYRNTTQARLKISANSTAEYIAGLGRALSTTHPDSAALGVKVNGEFRQLNANVLQIENEYYSSMRPKPEDRSVRAVGALARDGIAYVEARTLDLNPYEPLGLSLGQMHFLETLLLQCVLADSPPISAAEQNEIDRRELAVAWEGRRPNLLVEDSGRVRRLRDLGSELLDQLEAPAELLDADDRHYRDTLVGVRAQVADPEQTLSARLIDDIQSQSTGFFDFSFELGQRHKAWALERGNTAERTTALELEAQRSLVAQAELEQSRTESFEAYLARYFSA
jgi:glutamate--cysteine ligase